MKTLDESTRSALANHRKGINQDAEISARVDGSDTLTSKYLNRMNQKQLARSIGAPPDEFARTLWVGGVEDTVKEEHLLRKLSELAGELESLRMVKQAKCAFVTYANQTSAFADGNKLFENLEVGGKSLSVRWAKPKAKRAGGEKVDGPSAKRVRTV